MRTYLVRPPCHGVRLSLWLVLGIPVEKLLNLDIMKNNIQLWRMGTKAHPILVLIVPALLSRVVSLRGDGDDLKIRRCAETQVLREISTCLGQVFGT
jgi:hypothetical protein